MEQTAKQILDALNDPPELEALYRRDPAAFRDALEEVTPAQTVGGLSDGIGGF